jgi:pimeloyl-ACP methyl ester carboxylesterase
MTHTLRVSIVTQARHCRKGSNPVTRSIQRNFVNVAGNLKIAVYDFGGFAPACVMLHGLGEGAYVWNDFINAIGNKWRPIALDLLGHGDSDWLLSESYSLDRHVAATIEVLRSFSLGDLVLIGHSLGGDIAVQLAEEFHDVLRGLVIVDTGPGEFPETLAAIAEQMKAAHRDYESVNEFRDWLHAYRPFIHPDAIDYYASAALRLSENGKLIIKFDPALGAMLDAEYDDEWWNVTLPLIVAPTLIVRGQASSVVSQKLANHMCNLLTSGAVAVVPVAGHGVMNDNPDGFRVAVVPFLAGLQMPRRAAPGSRL